MVGLQKTKGKSLDNSLSLRIYSGNDRPQSKIVYWYELRKIFEATILQGEDVGEVLKKYKYGAQILEVLPDELPC